MNTPLRTIFFSFVFIYLMATLAFAQQVHVFMPQEQDVSPMELRRMALAEGFAQATLDAARQLLPGELSDVRSSLFREYMTTHATPYIQGYKMLSSQATDEGVILQLDVQINKKSLRNDLKSMGFLYTLVRPIKASVVWPTEYGDETIYELNKLMVLTGVENVSRGTTALVIQTGPESTFEGHLESDSHEWRSINKDLPTMWFSLWRQYFSSLDEGGGQLAQEVLTVSGWFSPDGVLEFDRTLKEWDGAIQDVELAELSMLSSGVGARWTFRILNDSNLKTLLNSYLPQRGLTYQLAEDVKAQ